MHRENALRRRRRFLSVMGSFDSTAHLASEARCSAQDDNVLVVPKPRALVAGSQQRIFRVQHAIAERHAPPGDRGNALARNNDPHQVQRIGGRNGDALAIRIRRQLALDAQRLYRHREGELLAQKSIDESPAAHFAAIFETAVADLQLTPSRQIRFPHQQVAEDDAVAPQQHPAAGFDDGVATSRHLHGQKPQSARPESELPAAGFLGRSHRFPLLPESPDVATAAPTRPLPPDTADRGAPDRSPRFCVPAQTAPTRSPESQTPATGGSLRASHARPAPAYPEQYAASAKASS